MPPAKTTLDRLSAALEGRYSIVREIGAGGMATVYLAEDVRHRRKVAIKVLHPELTAVLGPERFLIEIELTANLQHPHILPLFDSGAADNLLFYVMPFVDGETLRQKLAREHQLPIADALRMTTDIADALEYAHKHGVVHRDIKPENVLLHEGRPLVADFGIALAVQQAGGERMTQTGMSLGTPQYMAPEQAMGDKAVDHRADIYALGAMTYEMLTGEPPFTGPNAQAVVAKILTTDPSSLTAKRRSVPPHVNAAVLTALEKMPADRFASAAEFSEAIAGRGPVLADTRAIAAAVASSAAPRWRLAALVSSGIAIATLALAAWMSTRGSRADAETPNWQYIEIGDTAGVSLLTPGLALSPDGSTIVFREAVVGGRLGIKHRSELDARLVPGTERASNPTFSPDGEWVAFFADGKLKKVRVRGGAAITIADSVAGPYGGAAWLDDGSLVYVAPNLIELRRIGEAGGSYTVVLHDTLTGGRGMGYPTPLPRGRGVLLQMCSSGCVSVGVHAVDFRTGTRKAIIEDAIQAWYLPSGHLLYVRSDGAALVAPFDLDELEITGGAVPALENVFRGGGFAQLAWSRSGSLVYVSGSVDSRDAVVVRVTAEGAVSQVDTSWSGQFNSLALSPDGRRLAVGVGVGSSALNIWVKQLDRGPLTRLTFGGRDRRPVWSPDGRLVAFIRDTLTTGVVVTRPADGSGSDRLLLRLPQQLQEVTWSRDGQWLVVRTDNAGPGAGDLIGVRTSGDSTPVLLAGSPFSELHPEVSPDGNWLAYTSNESGRDEVYVRPFPATSGGLWQVSVGGGSQPRWSSDTKRVFYLDAGNRLISADVRSDPAFEVVEQRTLFTASGFISDAFHQSYDVAPDGSFFFVTIRQRGGAQRQRLVRVDNWFQDIQARLKQ